MHLGIDVAKAKLDCALLMGEGTLQHKVVLNTIAGLKELMQWLSKRNVEQLHVCMEATGIYWELAAEYLVEQGLVVSVMNPVLIKHYAKSRLARTKTDKVDAGMIAYFCKERKPTAWIAPSKSIKALRAMVLRLQSLQDMCQKEKNRVHVAHSAVKLGIQAHIEHIDKEILELHKLIKQHIKDDPELQHKKALLESIPGIAQKTSAILLAFYADIARFDNARKAAAFAGLDPRQHQSGSSVLKKARMSKVGHAFIRKSLFMPALTALNKTKWGNLFKERLAATGKPGKVIVGAMMRKLIHVMYGVLKSGMQFKADLHHV